MSKLAQLHRQMRVAVTSADNQIRATIHGRGSLSLQMRPGTYGGYDERELAQQLSQTLDLLQDGYRQGCRKAISAAGGRPYGEDHVDWDANRRRFHAARDEVVSRGISVKRRVRVRSTGLRQHCVEIKPGALSTLDEKTLLAEVTQAVRAMRADHQRQVAELKDSYFHTMSRAN